MCPQAQAACESTHAPCLGFSQLTFVSAVRSACVPGSHHANFALPVTVASCEEEMGLVKQLEFEAGDVLFFAVRHSPNLMICDFVVFF